jgi:hypothetical protein
LKRRAKRLFAVHGTGQDEAGVEVVTIDVDWHVSKPRAG